MTGTTMDQIAAALAAGAKGAATGAIGGPIGMGVGALIGFASDLVPTIFGQETKPALAAAAQAITGLTGEDAQVTALAKDPAASEQFRLQALQIAADQQKADRQTQLDMMQAALAQQQAAYADTANARQQMTQLAQVGSKMAWASPVVSIIVTVGFFSCLMVMVFARTSVDPAVLTVINVLVGTLAAGFMQTINFWLGSSAGSQRKSELLAGSVPSSMLPNPAVVVPADSRNSY